MTRTVDPIIYARTRFGEDILIGAGYIPQKTEFRKRPLVAEFLDLHMCNCAKL